MRLSLWMGSPRSQWEGEGRYEEVEAKTTCERERKKEQEEQQEIERRHAGGEPQKLSDGGRTKGRKAWHSAYPAFPPICRSYRQTDRACARP